MPKKSLSGQRFLKLIAPDYSHRRMIIRKIITSLTKKSSLNKYYYMSNILDPKNIQNFFRFGNKKVSCPICGVIAKIVYDFPNIQQCIEFCISPIRETLQCKNCGSSMRNRTLARQFLDTLWIINSRNGQSLEKYKKIKDITNSRLAILDTDSKSIMSQLLLNQMENYTRSAYIPGLKFGSLIEDRTYNIDLEKIDFLSETFDIVLTSDVAEHVRDISSAHSEIYRVLKKGGCYIFTVPFNSEVISTRILVDTTTEKDLYLEPVQIHGDPLTEGIVTYRIFGRDIIAELEAIGFNASYDLIDNAYQGIFNSIIFTAYKDTRSS